MSPRSQLAGLAGAVSLSILLIASCEEPGPRIERLDGSRITAAELEAGVSAIMEAARLPGLQLAVINDGQIGYLGAFGVKSTETGEPVSLTTVFSALSFSKTMFTFLVLQLVDERALDLDRPLVSYLPRPLPEYEFYRDLEGDDRHTRLTARMALSHTTGLPNWRWFTPDGRLQFLYEPGDRFSYSGEGIYLLQQVVEEVTGGTLEELARARLFEPLGMERTSFLLLPGLERDHAVGHDHFLNSIGIDRQDEANAAGSAHTTAEDFAKYLAAVMRGEGLSDAARDEMLSRQVAIEHVRMFGPLSRRRIGAAPTRSASWGLGWGQVESEHGLAIFHTGNDGGNANYHIAFLDRGTAIVLLGNSQRLENAAPALTELIIGDVYSPYGFLGYEAYDAPHFRLAEIVATHGLESGLEYYGSLPDKGIGSWHTSEWDFLDGTGRELLGLERFRQAAEFYRHFLREHPDQAGGYDRLAAAHVALRELESAQAAYRAGLELSEPGSVDAARFAWKLRWIGGLLSPLSIPDEVLRSYAGDYGPRHVELREGSLYYYRDDADDPAARRLYAISEDVFVMAEADFFRLRFEPGASGAAKKVTGHYIDGQRDESRRDPIE